MAEREEILLTAEAAEVLRISVALLQRLCRRGDGPPFFMIGSRRRFIRSELIAWQLEQETGTRVMRRRSGAA